jgi:serine/threonine protein kinase
MSCDFEHDPFSFGQSSGGGGAAAPAALPVETGWSDFEVFSRRYRVDFSAKPVGKGKFGVVNFGVILESGKPVVCKKVYIGPPIPPIPKPPSKEDIFREAQIGMSLDDSPHLCKVFEISVHKDFVYIAMECIRGDVANDFFNQKQNSSLSTTNPSLFRKILIQIATGILTMHRAGISHRDIKFDNIIIECEGEGEGKGKFRRAVIIDYGFARKVEEIPSICKEGTIEYIAPEIIQGTLQTEKVDTWAFGVMLFVLLHKKFPIQSKHPKSLDEERRFVYFELLRLKVDIQSPYTGDDKNIILLHMICAKCLVFDQSARISAEELLAMLSS